eukprot:4204409-Amphidinium_carterae.1
MRRRCSLIWCVLRVFWSAHGKEVQHMKGNEMVQKLNMSFAVKGYNYVLRKMWMLVTDARNWRKLGFGDILAEKAFYRESLRELSAGGGPSGSGSTEGVSLTAVEIHPDDTDEVDQAE